ncbi:hypothetical protein ACEPAH_7617 [Sanghuangporus vaninii]
MSPFWLSSDASLHPILILPSPSTNVSTLSALYLEGIEYIVPGADSSPTSIRRRKMRCDGVKPSCFQCIRAERANECEYDDGINKTSTQMLYERLAMLEKRYRDLQAAKRPGQNGRAPSYPRANASRASGSRNSNVNLSRSNSAPERVHSQPRVNGSEFYDQNLSSSVTSQDNTHSFALSNYDPGNAAPGTGVSAMCSNMQTPNNRPFDITSLSLSSHSSSRSGRSTPSTSDFSRTELTFHPKYAFTYGYQQSPAVHSPYMVPNTDISVGVSPDDTSHFEMAVPTHGMQNVSVHPEPQHRISQNSSLDIGDDGYLSPAVLEHLIDLFVAHSQQAGLSLLSSRIVDILSFNIADLSSSIACAMNCILLWGAHFSPVKSINARKHQFLRDALAGLPALLSAPLAVPIEFQPSQRSSAIDPTGDGRYNMMIAISISTMLATYFFAEGRTLEGSYHASTASRLAICAGLHHSPDPRLWRDSSSSSAGLLFDSRPSRVPNPGTDLLPYPLNLNSALERHHVFWNVFVLDRAWNGAGRLAAASSQWAAARSDAFNLGNILMDKDSRTATTTAWPGDWGLLLFEGSQDDGSSSLPSGSPVEDFLSGFDGHPTQSVLQLRAKSTALFEAASRVASLHDPYNPNEGLVSSFATLQRTLSMFIKMLPPLTQRGFGPVSFSKASQFTTHTLVHTANIRLYERLAEKAYNEGYIDDPTTLFIGMENSTGATVQGIMDGLLGYERVFSDVDFNQTDQTPVGFAGMACAAADRCLSSAREVTKIASCIAPDDFPFLEPIIAPCWAFASDALLRELRRIWAVSQPSAKANLVSEINILKSSLKRFGTVFAIGNIEARRVSSALNSITGGSTLSVP